MGPNAKVRLALLSYALINLGLLYVGYHMLEVYLVLGGLMNTCQYGFIYSIIHVMQEYFMPVNRNMENHPGKQYNHKTYGSVLA
jgi:hypothetical protein